MGEVDPLVSLLLRCVVIYGGVTLTLGGCFQLYRREFRSAAFLLVMASGLFATLMIKGL